MHAQARQASQVAHAGRDGAAELVVGEPTEGASMMSPLSTMRGRIPMRCTHRFCNPIRLPRLVGMLPLSWLSASPLQAQPWRLSAVHWQILARRTHSSVNPAMLPRLAGMVPLSWLVLRTLTMQQRRLRFVLGRSGNAAHAHARQLGHVAQTGWDGAAELVAKEEAESASGSPQHFAAVIHSAAHAQNLQPSQAAQA